MAQFFLRRPVFALVLSLLICLLGILAIKSLPIAQYPSVAPPSIQITATYPGASAQTLTDTVTSIIEQQLNGIDNLLYMNSTSSASGQAQITLFFKPGTNPDTAQVQVQNKVQAAMPTLPATVQQQGVTVLKATRNFFMFFTISTEDGSMDQIQLGNYLASTMLDPIRRVDGVGEVNQFGTENAMRVWLDPQKLANFRMTPNDVVAAIQAQNAQVSLGQLGDLPAVEGQRLNVIMQGQQTLRTAKEFGDILLRVNEDGSRVLLRDVAKVELAGLSYANLARVNGQPASAAAIKLAPTANALETAKLIKAKIASLEKNFPPGMKVNYPLDTSGFVKISLEEVVKTLCEAIVLVFLVMYLFLQNFRATLIPSIVVPVALLGTFGAMAAFGFSINVLTMFGMVLAIGILVDDAIVVVENVERIMSTEGLSAKDATAKAMKQITAAIVGMTLVLTAVFVPMAFFTGSVGNIYRQFSMSLVASLLLSLFLAMSLTPALCASILKHSHGDAGPLEKRGFFGWFNRRFESFTNGSVSGVAWLLKRSFVGMISLVVVVVLCGWFYIRMPSAFLPSEDQGYFITAIQLPAGATAERTGNVIHQVEDVLKEEKTVADFITVAGFSFNGRAQNSALAFVRLKDWEERQSASDHVTAVIGRAMGKFGQMKDAIVFALNPPAIPELGTSSGFDFWLKDEAGLGYQALVDARTELLGMAAKNPALAGVRLQGLVDVSQMEVKIDHEKAASMGVSLGELNAAMQTAFGSTYVNNFVNGSRVQRVLVQLDAKYRMTPDDLGRLYVRNSAGKMLPLATFVTAKWSFGPPQLQRYNGAPAFEIIGTPAPGYSSGDAMNEMEKMAEQLPKGISFEWSGQSYEERLSGSQATALYGLSLLVVFLCLAALYESWSVPFAVLFVVPLGVIGALVAANMRDFPNDVYFKVGLLTIVGLSTKNAILIIEYAIELQQTGLGIVEAVLQSVRLRLRPILMTSVAFILGVLPLVLRSGAGSASQNAIGTGVLGGMISATLLAVFLVPVFYLFVVKVVTKLTGREPHYHAPVAVDVEPPETLH